MNCDFRDRFASRMNSPEEAPEPLRSALLKNLPTREEVRMLIFGPANKGLDKRWPASILAVTERGWIGVSGLEEVEPTVAGSDFGNTLLVELTDILLYGMLRVDFASGGKTQCATFYFNTVMDWLYREAVQLLIDGMEGFRAAGSEQGNGRFPGQEALSLKFRNALLEDLLAGRHVLKVLHWPAVRSAKRVFRRELAPEALVALTESELLFISEEKAGSWFRRGRTEKYGSIATYCPRSRITDVRLTDHGELDTLDVDVRATGGGQKLKIEFPKGLQSEMKSFLKSMSPGASPNEQKSAERKEGTASLIKAKGNLLRD